jgi:hypothetical protein
MLGLLLLPLLSLVSSTHLQDVSPQQWRALNATVGGRLRAAAPFALPCFSLYNNRSVPTDASECSAIQANYSSPSFRVESFSANMNVSTSRVGTKMIKAMIADCRYIGRIRNMHEYGLTMPSG